MKTKLLRKIRKRFNIIFDPVQYSWHILDKTSGEYVRVYTMKDAIFVMSKHFMSIKKLERRLYE